MVGHLRVRVRDSAAAEMMRACTALTSCINDSGKFVFFIFFLSRIVVVVVVFALRRENILLCAETARAHSYVCVSVLAVEDQDHGNYILL